MLTLYGIPNCDTVKKARAWLDARGVTYAWVDFRKSPPATTFAMRGNCRSKATGRTSAGNFATHLIVTGSASSSGWRRRRPL